MYGYAMYMPALFSHKSHFAKHTTILYYDFDVFNLSRTFSVIWKGKSSYLFFNSCFQDKKMN